jgi:hypothetical protein
MIDTRPELKITIVRETPLLRSKSLSRVARDVKATMRSFEVSELG